MPPEKKNGKRGLYERQVAHNLLLDHSFREMALSSLEEESFLYPAWRTIFLSVRDTGDLTAGYKAPFALTETEQGDMEFLREDLPSRETDVGKLLDYVEELRQNPVKEVEGKAKPKRKFPSLEVCAENVKDEEIEWLYAPYLPLGKVSILEGDPGLGKTFLALEICAAITTGRPLPGQPHRTRELRNILYLTAEDGLGDTLKGRLRNSGADWVV